MRIGNLDDLDQTGQSDNLIHMLQPENQKPRTRAEKWKNWWHYHKWYVILGAVLLIVVCNLIGNALGIFTKSPDLQIAYVGKAALPQDTVTALEQLFTALAADYNGDGEVLVQLNQYTSDSQTTDAGEAYYQYASEITLMADISEGESYFFLMDDPLRFQQEYQILASPDGGCPDQADYSVADKVIPWSQCPALSGADTGSYTETIAGHTVSGSNQDVLSDLCLGRRCFYTDKVSANAEACGALWDMLYETWEMPEP